MANQARSGLRPERDDRSPTPTVHMGSPRKIFGEALHPKTMEIDTVKLGSENSALRNSKLMRSLTDRCCIFCRLCKGTDSTRGHLFSSVEATLFKKCRE